MAPSRSFGKTEYTKVLVRVQETRGGAIVKTKSFAVYGQEHDDVAMVVEESLGEAFDQTRLVAKKRSRKG